MSSRALAILLCSALAACATKGDGRGPRAIATAEFAGVDMAYAANQVLMHEKHIGFATTCAVLNPGQDVRMTPPSYRVDDLGRAGVPRPNRKDLEMVRKIRRYVHSSTLRFAYLAKNEKWFIVYDAVWGPCTGNAPGYFVLNGGCNEFYMPSGQSDITIGVPECFSPPRPWIPHDRGNGDPKLWSRPGPN